MKIAYSALSSCAFCAFLLSLTCLTLASVLDLSFHMQFVFLDWTMASLIVYIVVVAIFNLAEVLPKTWPPRSWFW